MFYITIIFQKKKFFVFLFFLEIRFFFKIKNGENKIFKSKNKKQKIKIIQKDMTLFILGTIPIQLKNFYLIFRHLNNTFFKISKIFLQHKNE